MNGWMAKYLTPIEMDGNDHTERPNRPMTTGEKQIQEETTDPVISVETSEEIEESSTPQQPKVGGSDSDETTTEEPVYQPGMDWFVLRVASNKEKYVKETLIRKVQIEGLTDRVGRILVPTEKIKSLKGGKQRIVESKLYPGYVFVEMKLEAEGRIPQDVFFLIKETTGVGDFIGTAGHPAAMKPHEVEKMLHDAKPPEESPQVKMEFQKGDVVKITEGPFENNEGTVDEVYPDKGIVKVLVTIFGRQVPVEVEYWIISPIEE